MAISSVSRTVRTPAVRSGIDSATTAPRPSTASSAFTKAGIFQERSVIMTVPAAHVSEVTEKREMSQHCLEGEVDRSAWNRSRRKRVSVTLPDACDDCVN